jgi:putative MFS transporter
MSRIKSMLGVPEMTSRERGVLAATCVSSLGSFYTMAVTGFAMPQIQRGLSIPEDELGSLFALLRFGTLFSLVLAVAADRLGRRRLLILSVAGCAICNVATAFAQSGLALAWMQLGSRFFFGAQVLLAMVVVTEELSSDNRGWGLGVLAAVGGMGGALTVVAYMFVDSLPYGWRFLYVLGGMGLLTVPWLLRSLPETQRFSDQQSQADDDAPSGSPWQPLKDIMRLHSWRLVAMMAMVVPVMVVLEPASIFISKHLQDDLAYSPAQVGIFMGLCGIATPIGNVLAGSISDRFGRRPVTALMSLVLSGAVALFYNATGIFGLALGLALLMGSIGSIVVLHGALAAELFPTAFRSTAAGMREALGTVGASLGLAMVSLLYALTGSHPTSITWILIVTPISPLVILFFVPETARRELEEIAPND